MAAAASLRSSLPSRLRQLISGTEANNSSSSDTPLKVKAFIDKVIQCPLQDIEIPLSGFRWEYNKGNFHHWRPLFLHFDTYFKTYVSTRKDLLLTDDIVEDDTPFPKQSVLQILVVMQIILENCSNRSAFTGLEHFKLLLASTDPEVLIATLETLSSLVKIASPKPHSSGKLVGCGSINSSLLSLAQGWGSKEEGLGLYSCVVSNEKTPDDSLSLFPSIDDDKSQSRMRSTLYFELHATDTQDMGSSASVIHIPDLHTREEDDLSIMKQLVEQYNVDPEHRFLLLTRIRYAHASRSPKISRLYSKICLLAFIVLVQSGDSHDELVSFFANEPEYTNELVRLVKSEETISPAIRMLAVQALGAQLVVYSSSHERARILNTGCNRVQLINVLQREISSLNKSTDTPSIAYIEALLHFHVLQVITTSSPGNIIRGSGMVSTFLPLIDDTEPAHMNLVLLAVKILQKLMDYSNSAVTLLQDLGGVDLLTNRLHTEVVKMINSMKIGESSDTIDDQTFPHMLIRILLKALSSATYASANTTRPQNPQNISLPATLMLIFKNMVTFGGDIYSAAVQVMCEMIHKDPTCYASLDEIGLPSAFISSVAAGVLPSTRALTCVPNGLGAICLNTKGLEEVKEKSALSFLVDVFTHEKYVLPMNDAIVPLANAVEELLRHVTSLRVTGVDLIIEIINKIASIEDSKGAEQSGKVTGSNVTDMDTEEKEKSTLEGVSNEPFIQSCTFHVMVLVHRTMENAETCRIFVEKSGIEALLKLLLRPSITQSSKGMSIALHSTMVFKSFTQHHSAPLASAFCSSLRDYLKSALAGFDLLSKSFLLDPKSTPDAKVISSLSLVEFLLFLAASKDNRWIAGLLQEFGNGSKDVLEDIGRIHREILWQLALLEDAKFEKNEDASDSSADVSRSSESGQQRFDSFRQFLDPLMRRRMSGLSFDSQFFDLINLYHDITHPSEPHIGAGHRSAPSGTADMMRLLSLHITHLFQELGKAMLLPSRRRDELVTGTPSGSVASTFASITLDHMNFEGREASWSAKCRYLGKVVDFIDDILLEKSDSCNPILLNCLYGRGVIKSVLTTFEATSELLFTVNKTPASPMETDEGVLKQTDTEEMNHSWINDSLANYGKLMDHLVTSSFILSSSSKHLLTQPLVNGGNIPLPQDPEVFVRVLQSMILKTVLPLWTHPRFVDCNDDIITTVISIIRNVFSGVEVKNVSNGGSRLAAPLSETTISTIVEMGFTRPHAEEALRQIGSNSVELAMEWLFSHPEQVPEDDELAHALAMSLGNNSSDKSLGNNSSDAKENTANETSKQIEEENVQLPPVHELLSTCKKLLQVKDSLAFSVRDLLLLICLQDDGQYKSNVLTFIVDQIADNGKNTMMISSLFHVLALLLNDDNDLREVAFKSGLVKVAADRLSNWNPENDNTKTVPKWVTPAFLAVDRLAQVDQKLNADIISELLKKDDVGNQTHIVIDEGKQNKVQPTLGLIDIEDQKRFVEISCHYLKNPLPAETVHAVLQLCSTLTRNHSVALSFLNAGGLPLLLSLPSNSLFVGFDNVATNIIRHILEDPQTLQQAMESEIKQSVVAAVNRQSTSRLTPRSFLLNLTSVISRDPVVFMRAAQSVCQIEMDGDRPCIVLLKGKSKEKEKTETMADGKPPEANVKHVKVHRKPPQSFVSVIELLLDSVMNFVPPVKDEPVAVSGDKSSLTDMDIDLLSNKGKGKENESENGEQEQHASIAKVVFILKLLTETLMMYGPSVHVLLRRDGEIAQKGPSSTYAGGIFHHILHQFLPYSKSSKKEKKTDVDWRHKLADRASKFLVAACVRSSEARKRIFGEINNVFNDFVSSSVVPQPPGDDIQAFVDLLSGVLLARSPTGSSISSEVSVSFIDVGLIRSLPQLLQVLDLDHPDSLKVAPGLMKVLEVVTKEHVLAAEASAGKGDNTIKSLDHTENEQTENIGTEPREIEPATDDMEHDQENDGSFVPPSEDDYMHETSDNTRVVENGFDSVGITFEIQPDSQESLDEDDDMSGDERDEVDEDEDEEEEGEEDGDEEENNDLEDEVHHLPHLDTDQDDNEIDEDDFDEDMNEEEDDDDEDDDDGDGDGGGRVILGLSEEMNGINVLDHIEVLGRDNGFPNDTFHMMPVEVFGSRRQGRTTSIYNILGRSPDTSAPAQHPLLVDPSGQAGQVRDRNLESTSSRLDAVFRSLRNGRRGDRPSMWANDGQSGGSNPSSIPSGFEELLVSHLRPPTPVNPPDHETGIEGQTQDETAQLQASAGMVPEPTTENDGNNEPTINELQTSTRHPQSVEMQSDHNSVDGVSQESSENEATLGESLRSLDVETGSTNASLVNTITTSASGSLHSVPEASENHGQETEQGAAASAPANDARIDPTFLDALPDELRAEVLSGQPGPATQVVNTEPQNGGVNDIDPEFLAALPPDIRAEVLAQQQAQVAQRSHELEGQPVEMDTVSIIATFPSEIREEVLLTSSDDVLSNLTPALVAEANMLRERFRRNNRTLFGMFPRNRRGESSRRGEGIGSSLDRISGAITHRSTGSHPIETDGAPLVDTKDLKALTRLLRVVQPIYRPHLQRLLLNLCAHADTRAALIKILMDLLVLDTRTPNSDLNASEPSYRLYACQSHLMYSRPQSFDGVPPLLSRRVLETLTYLARNHKFVAKLMLQFRIQTSDQVRGKAIMNVQDDDPDKHQYQDGLLAITLLLSLLKQPLYLRSIAHLEQLLNLLDVIIDNAESTQVLVQNEESVAEESAQMSTLNGETKSDAKSSKMDDAPNKPSSSGVKTENESHNILLNLPQEELRLLCSLLASESLSDSAYALVADILKKLVAIAPHHCHLFITELAGSMKNLTNLAINELRVFGETEKALINASGSDGAAILRVIQALSSLVTSLNQEKEHTALENEQTATISLVNAINADLEPLWVELSTCISKIESFTDTTPEASSSSVNLTSRPSGAFPPLPAGTQNILPHIESFFVMCEKLHFGHDSDDAGSPGTSVKSEEKNAAFVKFADKHRKLLNGFIRQNPGLLEKSFLVMLKVPRFIDFDNKRSYFRSKIKHQHEHHHHSGLRISVRRAYILEDSYNQLRMRSTQDLKGRLTVHFQGEEGIDGGGLTREWYQLLSRVIFDKGALLFTTVGNESTFQPNPNSVFQTEHLSYFKFVGRVVGKALFDGQLLDVHFTRSFYKHMLGAKVTYHDIEAIDPGYFKNLKWMLENDISDILDLTFSIDADEEKLILFEKAEVTDHELIPGGRNIRVTEENKHEYVNLIAEHRLTTAIRPQINAFLEGFNELIPRENISIFHDKELELLISGLPDIDLDDMRANTEYSGYSAASPVIHWFWEVAQALSKEDKARLLQFVTGTSKVPLEGFSALQGISGAQKFQIHKAYGSSDRLPSAHTCFNQLDLPEYPSKQHLEERLLLAIHEANEGFGFG